MSAEADIISEFEESYKRTDADDIKDSLIDHALKNIVNNNFYMVQTKNNTWYLVQGIKERNEFMKRTDCTGQWYQSN